MKKCPYCAELIQDEAIICRYCGQKLTQVPISLSQPRKEPSAGISLLMGILILIVIIGIAYFIGSTWYGTTSDLENILVMYQLVVMLAVTFLAVPGLNPDKRGFLRYVGIFILGVIPILGWIVIYWAGKGLARILTQA